MRTKITTYEWLQKAISELTDDPTRPWRDYPCLDWPFAVTIKPTGKIQERWAGYGQTCVNGKNTKVPRIAWELANGPILHSLHVLHRCDRPICFRPIHLFLGTNDDNIADRMAKGHKPSHGALPMLRGEAHGLAKLTWEQVRKIRALKGTDSAASVALGFNVCKETVRRIWIGTHWIEANDSTNEVQPVSASS